MKALGASLSFGISLISSLAFMFVALSSGYSVTDAYIGTVWIFTLLSVLLLSILPLALRRGRSRPSG